MFVNCSSNKFGSLINSNPKKANTPGSDNQSSQTPPSPVPNPSPIPNPSSSVKLDYQSVSSAQGDFKNFKTTNHPDILTEVNFPTNTYVVILTAGGQVPTKLKFFLPPGTVSFTANFLAYLSDDEARGVMQMYNPPSSPLSMATLERAYSPDNSGGANGGLFDHTILMNLRANKEVFLFGSARAGLMPISYGGEYPSSQEAPGGYVYANFQYPGGILGVKQWNIYVDKECYRNWYFSTTWNSDGNPSENVTHRCK